MENFFYFFSVFMNFVKNKTYNNRKIVGGKNENRKVI